MLKKIPSNKLIIGGGVALLSVGIIFTIVGSKPQRDSSETVYHEIRSEEVSALLGETITNFNSRKYVSSGELISGIAGYDDMTEEEIEQHINQRVLEFNKIYEQHLRNLSFYNLAHQSQEVFSGMAIELPDDVNQRMFDIGYLDSIRKEAEYAETNINNDRIRNTFRGYFNRRSERMNDKEVYLAAYLSLNYRMKPEFTLSESSVVLRDVRSYKLHSREELDEHSELFNRINSFYTGTQSVERFLIQIEEDMFEANIMRNSEGQLRMHSFRALNTEKVYPIVSTTREADKQLRDGRVVF